MLHGPLLGKIVTFALPLALSSILQQLFNSVDIAVVGKFASSQALAAVGSNAPVINLLINLFVGISMGANAVISNHIGRNDRESIKKAVSTSGMLSLICGAVLMFLGIVVAKPIHELMGTPAEVMDMAVEYLVIYFIGIPFFMVFNFGSAILRSMGDTKRPLYILIGAGIINTILNLLFVIVFKMGVSGVAIATAISNAFSSIWVVKILANEDEPFKLGLKSLKIDSTEFSEMLKIGLPAGLQGVIFSISNVIIQTSINSYGFNAIAGNAATLNYETYCYFIVTAFNGAAISFVGQNFGAGDMFRIKKAFKICMFLSIVCCALANLVFVLGDNFFLRFFTDSDEVIAYGHIRMRIAVALESLLCLYEIPGSALRGMGYSVLPMLLTILGTCVLRIAWVYLVCPLHRGFDVLIMVYPISWLVTGIMVLTSFHIIYSKFCKHYQCSRC